MKAITLTFIYYQDFVGEIEQCKIQYCRMQPLIIVEPMEGVTPPGFTHTWTVILTALAKAAAGVEVILAARLYVGEAWSGSASALTANFQGPQDIDLTMAVELTANALAEAGFDVCPGFYTHDVFGYGAAPSLWHFQGDGRLVAGALPEEELEND